MYDIDSEIEAKARLHDDINPPGKKRPVHRGPDGRMTPVPWVGADAPYDGLWALINGARATLVERNKLCLVCGIHRGDDWVYALFNGEAHDHRDIWVGPPSPTYGHPECILKAVLYCPHLKKQEYPAMTQDRKTKLTEDDLKKIVQDKKIAKRDGDFASGVASYGCKKSYDAVR